MATRKKKKNSSGGILGTILILCILTVCAVAVGKSMLGSQAESPADGTDVEASQSSSGTVSSTDSSRPASSDSTDSASSVRPSSDVTTDTSSDEPSSVTSNIAGNPDNTVDESGYVSKNKTDSFDKDEWYMLLANPDNPIPDGYTFEQATVYSAGRNWIMDVRCADDMKAMLAAAKEDGVDLIICSAYRTLETQTKNFNNKVQEYINKGYSEAEAKKITATIIAVPGTSEHHTGMAADIVTPSYQRLNEGFDQTDAYKWLEAHCAEYGFALRYRKDKQDITKIIYEPWHYRYVGKEAATIMMNEKLSFEEFLEKYGT